MAVDFVPLGVALVSHGITVVLVTVVPSTIVAYTEVVNEFAASPEAATELVSEVDSLAIVSVDAWSGQTPESPDFSSDVFVSLTPVSVLSPLDGCVVFEALSLAAG